MNKEVISTRQGIKMAILFLFGSTLIMGTGGAPGRDMWISTLAAVIATVPVYMIYARILSLFPGKDLFEILEHNFGKAIGKLMGIVFVWFAFHLGALVMRNIGEFIFTESLTQTPMIAPMIGFALLCIWGAKAGVETIAKCADYFILFVMVLLVVYSLLAIPIMDVENVPPIMGKGLLSSLKGTFSAFSYPFGEALVLMYIFSSIKEKKATYRIFLMALLVAGITISFIALRNIMILGPFTLKSVYFPAYTAITRINIGNFLQRIEVGVTIVFLLCGFMKTSICLLGATKGLGRILGFDDYRILVTPVGLLMLNLSYIIYGSIMEMYDWAFKIWPYYAFIFEAVLPVFIWIFIEVKEKLRNTSANEDAALDEGGSS